MIFETIWQDILYSLRTMRKNPAFGLTAVFTLALGIGGNTAIFTVIRSVLLKPLEYRDPDRLVYLSIDNPRRNVQDASFTEVRLKEMKSAAKSFDGLGAYGRPDTVTISGSGEPEALKAARVSANFLDILGVQPALGRSFRPEEDQHGGPPVAMISSGLWSRRFGSDPGAAGRTATLDSTTYTVIGVLPPGFEFPFAGVDVWFTRPSEWSQLPPRFWGISILTGFARLKPQVSLEQTRAEMEVLNLQYMRAHPANSMDVGTTMRVVWLKDRLVTNVRGMLWTLFGAVGFVLLIACANVASLLLARATSRSREFAVRAALGAARGRLIRQLLAESLVLAVAGGALGAFLAKWCLSAIKSANALSLPTVNALYLPGAGDLRLDGAVLGFTVALSIATGVLFGLIPSLQISRPDLADVLRAAGAAATRGFSGKVAGVNPLGLLVVAQVALSIVLLVGAALLMQSFARVHSVDPGFHSANLLTMKVTLPPVRYDTDRKKAAFFDEAVRRLETLPGVPDVTMVTTLPSTTWIRTNITRVEGHPPLDETQPTSYAVIQSVTPTYFHTLGISLRRGREFTSHDNAPGAPPVMLINESLARILWPGYPSGENPVGRHISEGYDKLVGWIEVVGVVANIHEGGLAFDAVPEFYLPSTLHPPQTAYLVLRTAGDPLNLARAARQQVLAVDADQPVSDIKTMAAVLETTLGQRRLTMLLLGTFAGVALLLALVGIYGAIAYSVAQRTQEVGIRRALGAQQSDILRLMLRRGLTLTLAGVAIGTGAAFALTRVMKAMLFHVSATDPATFAGIAILFLAVAMAASYIPARRAARIDPMDALRVG
ncbi:MAG TPA: ABC transporter permease [Bryobacteraceae bacterium]|nr:ABC transporter permease [Bryobacteraceae bacterium]